MKLEASLNYFKKRRNKVQIMEEECAIYALEKQIPKKLKVKKVGRFGLALICPSCESQVAMIWDSVLQGKYKQNYCHNCGQALDWSDNNG